MLLRYSRNFLTAENLRYVCAQVKTQNQTEPKVLSFHGHLNEEARFSNVFSTQQLFSFCLMILKWDCAFLEILFLKCYLQSISTVDILADSVVS